MPSKNLYGIFDPTPEPEDYKPVERTAFDAPEVPADATDQKSGVPPSHVEDSQTLLSQVEDSITLLPIPVDTAEPYIGPEDVKVEDFAPNASHTSELDPPNETHADITVTQLDEFLENADGNLSMENSQPTSVKREDHCPVIDLMENTTPAPVRVPRRRKRTRAAVEVVVPTPESLYGRRQPLLPAQEATVQRLRNPNFPVKIKEERQLSTDSVYNRIAKVGMELYPGVPDDPIFTSLVAPREFYSHLFGGSCQSTFPTISKRNLERHGYDDFMYTLLDWEPHAPQIAGAPGLWYELASDPHGPHGKGSWGVLRVIVRMAPSQWLYMGQYTMTPAEPLTAREWLEQKPIVKHTWVSNIQRGPYGRYIRCRVTLRKQLEREPEHQEIKNAWDTDNDFKGLTAEDISSAFARGEEQIYIYCMKCVGYDEAFQRKVVDNFATWVPRPRTERGQGARAMKKARPTNTSNTPVKGRKRRRSNDSGSPEEDELEEGDPAVKDVVGHTVEQAGDLRRSKRVRRPPRLPDADSDIEEIHVVPKNDPKVAVSTQQTHGDLIEMPLVVAQPRKGAMVVDDLSSVASSVEFPLSMSEPDLSSTVHDSLSSKVYECLRTLDMEVQHIWYSPWSFVKVLYIWTRYTVFFQTAFDLRYIFESGIACDTQVVKAVIFTLFIRTWAIYGRSARAGSALVGIYLAFAGASIFFTLASLRTSSIFRIFDIEGCFLEMAEPIWQTLGPPILLAANTSKIMRNSTTKESHSSL
ncbi:hypothetical protein CONPUDRAFT_142400 [Coniophora puteana RWD-64-598 SS2]|uniref:Uncharacterized protein n=1 Tax=Coniophora puteana (strain RWD-64-598) TaxID=741705 RepID=A0A5M3MXN8_CONPW|nr:uncharacterized protein CONPUDRAFT_142400 [Coniophora puteana RWD-64-598 SS2]EIW83872.1 hypothetical protein CONPUDRAFT_142400 [Coniophora puteana RWD-64-598 SS2]